MSEDFISGLQADLVEAMDRYERRSPYGRLAAGRYPQLLRPATLARVAAGAAIIVGLVAAVLTVWRESDVERPAATPGKKVVTTDLDAGIRFSLDGRVLTVQLLPRTPSQTIRRVSGVRTSLTCGANGASPPSDSGATTLTQLWPAGQMSLSYRFRRDISKWCRLEDPVGRSVAFVVFPGAGALEEVNLHAGAWRSFLRRQDCGYNEAAAATAGGEAARKSQALCERRFPRATVQEIAIIGDRATVTFSDGMTIELHRDANGAWLISKVVPGATRPGSS